MFNFSTRRVGGIRFVKLGRFCFSFCLTRTFVPLKGTLAPELAMARIERAVNRKIAL